MNGIFVTGTDTNVGKTVVSAILMLALRDRKNACYWKPIQTGIETDDDTSIVRELASCAPDEVFNQGFRFEKPLSPHLSARLAGAEITVGKTLEFLPQTRDDKFWIVEGAGGILVPLNENELMIDFAEALNLPVVVAARSGLGTINHTLLTIEMLRNRKLEIKGVVMNGSLNEENRKAIEHFGRVKVLAEIPPLEPLTAASLHQWTSENSARINI